MIKRFIKTRAKYFEWRPNLYHIFLYTVCNYSLMSSTTQAKENNYKGNQPNFLFVLIK